MRIPAFAVPEHCFFYRKSILTAAGFDGILRFIMTKQQSSILKHALSMAFATLLSRVLGLFRVMFESMMLGGGALASAWQLAFMIPNMFRRLLGEGALGTALIPVLIHTEERAGTRKMREDLTVVFAVLGVVLVLIVAVVSLGATTTSRSLSGLGGVPEYRNKQDKMSKNHLIPLV